MARALLTDTERARLSGEVDVEDQRRYESISRVRRQINEELVKDVLILEAHQPELFGELRDVVCEE